MRHHCSAMIVNYCTLGLLHLPYTSQARAHNDINYCTVAVRHSCPMYKDVKHSAVLYLYARDAVNAGRYVRNDGKLQ